MRNFKVEIFGTNEKGETKINYLDRFVSIGEVRKYLDAHKLPLADGGATMTNSSEPYRYWQITRLSDGLKILKLTKPGM